MDSDVLIPLLSALAGAVVGGAASAWGSHVVARADQIRRTRIEIFRDLIPKVWTDTWGPKSVNDDELWDTLWRAAQTCRRRDKDFASKARDLQSSLKMYQAAAEKNGVLDTQTGTYVIPPEMKDEADNSDRKLHGAMQRWASWLEGKLS